MSKEKINFYIIAASSLFIGILADFLFYKKDVGISFFIFVSGVIAFFLVIIRRFEKKISKTQILFLSSAVILSVEVFLRSSVFLIFFNIIGSFYLLILSGVLFEEKNFFNSRLLKFISAPVIFIFGSLKNSTIFISEQKWLASDKQKIVSNELRSVIKGAIMALPLLFVLGWFLYSADLVVQAYVNKLFDLLSIKINFDLAAQILIIFIISYILIGIFNKIIGKEKVEAPEAENISIKSTGFIESMTVMCLVEALFAVFISIQFFYLFGGKNYVWGIDRYITYSEYAKNGFFELIVVAIISFLMIYAIDRSGKIETPKERKTFKFLSAALFIEISIILFSALKRLLLYVDGYGLTLSRFLAFALLFWIFSIFLIILYKIFLQKKNSLFIFMIFALSVAVWMEINILNPDATIARINIDRVAHGKKLDPNYFFNLSEDATAEVVKIFRLDADDSAKERVAMDLDFRYGRPGLQCYISGNSFETLESLDLSQCEITLFGEKIKNIETKKPWQSFNLSKSNALLALKENSDEIDKYEIRAWKKMTSTCEQSAAKCDNSCKINDWQSPAACKENCKSRYKKCTEFYEQKINPHE